MMHDWNSPWHGGAPWEAWIMFLLMLVVVAAVIVAVVYLVRGLSAPGRAAEAAARASSFGGQTPAPPDSPREILKRRYAAGEIDREDYLQRLKDLE